MDEIVKTYISLAQIAVSILLIGTIIIQQRGTALGSAFGGEGGGFYATRRGAQQKIFWASIGLGAAFIILPLLKLFL